MSIVEACMAQRKINILLNSEWDKKLTIVDFEIRQIQT